MNELITTATELLRKKYSPPIHSVAAALKSSNGKIITAVNIDHFLGFVCAETAALAIGINQGIYNFDEIVAVRMSDDGKIEIVDMCGKCRQIFHDYVPDIRVGTASGAMAVGELLPSAFSRQQQKIQITVRGITR